MEAGPDLAHSVHVEVGGLRPGREYFYRFKAGPEISPVGYTRTAAAPAARVDHFAFAFASCQHYKFGFYTAYQRMLEDDLDLVVHLGDYIYEGDAGTVRQHDGPEPMDLPGYRNRHVLYKTDPDLQNMHARVPRLVTWDDHEVDNNWAGDDADPDDPNFLERRAAAFKAYYEHMPLRRASVPRGPDMQLYRRATFGDLAEFNVLDTRQYRSDQVESGSAEASDPQRTMLGAEQEGWLFDGLDRSAARWNVLANQVPFRGETRGGEPFVGGDKWAGYVDQRNRILRFLGEREPSNPVVVTGDVHNNQVADLLAEFGDPDSEIVGTEFIGTSITSGGDGTPNTNYGPFDDPWFKFRNGGQRGYVRVRLTPEFLRADYRVVETVESRSSPSSTLESFVIEDGRRGVQIA